MGVWAHHAFAGPDADRDVVVGGGGAPEEPTSRRGRAEDGGAGARMSPLPVSARRSPVDDVSAWRSPVDDEPGAAEPAVTREPSQAGGEEDSRGALPASISERLQPQRFATATIDGAQHFSRAVQSAVTIYLLVLKSVWRMALWLPVWEASSTCEIIDSFPRRFLFNKVSCFSPRLDPAVTCLTACLEFGGICRRCPKALVCVCCCRGQEDRWRARTSDTLERRL
jgi:hypothetical protein